MRPLDAGAIAAIENGIVARRNALWFAVGDGLGLWDDIYDVEIGEGEAARTYAGRAGRFSMTALPSVGDGSVQGLDVTFSGADPTAFAFLAEQAWHQQPMEALVILLNPVTQAVVDVRLWFAGFIDVADIQDGGRETSLIVRCESTSRDLARPGTATRSEASQRRVSATDGFFKHVATMKTKEIWWGRLPPSTVGGRR